MPLCGRCGEENPERFKRCGFCGASLAAPAPARRKLATVLFCDMSGSTAMGERLDAESVRELMFRYFRDMREAIESHGGTVEKFIGDAVMAVFGVPTSHEDDAMRAVRAAADMQARLVPLNEEFERRFGSPVALRIGVNTGEVVAGDPSTADTIVTGDAVNVAARLEQVAPPGAVLLGEQTHKLVHGAVTVEPVAPLELKGKSEPVPAYRLLEVTAGAHRQTRRLDVGMVGRGPQLAELRTAFDGCVQASRCSLVTVLGEAGVGKSRLVGEFLDSVEDEAQVLVGHCRSYGEGITYWPLGEAVRGAAGTREEDSAERARARLADLLREEPDAERVLELISTAVGLGESAASAQEIAWGTRRLLEALARTRPLVFVVDDLHWAEPLFLDLLEALVAESRGAPILLLCLARFELLEQRPGWGAPETGFRSIRLEPLGAGESAQLIEGVLGRMSLADEVRARVIESADGNPLFLEELLGMLIDDGLIRREEVGWVATGDLSGISVPPTLEALLASRLDRLEGEQRAAIERASVEGQTFHRGAVEALSPAGEGSQVEAALDALADTEFIRHAQATVADDRAFRFRHILIRDAAYRSVAKRERAALHEQFARWLEGKAAARVGEYEELIGFHLEQGYRYFRELGRLDEQARSLAEQAAERLGRAGRRAFFSRGDIPAAINLLERASSLRDADDPARLRLRIDLGLALVQGGELAQADAVLTDVIERASSAGELRLELEARVEQSAFRLQTDPGSKVDEAMQVAERAIPVFEDAGDDLALARAWRLLGYSRALLQGRWEAAAEALGRALVHAGRAGSETIEGIVRHLLGVALVYGPTPLAEGARRLEEVLAGALDDPMKEAGVLICLGRIEASRGRFDDARRLIDRGTRMYEELGHVVLARSTVLQRCDVELLAGDYPAAERELRAAYELLKQVGDQSWLALVTARLARALYALGRYDEAGALLEVCERAAATRQAWPRVVLPATRAKLLSRRGRHEEAEALAREAVALAAETDALELHGDALVDLAEVLQLAGAPRGEVAPVVEEALRLYDRKGNVPSAERARRLLAGTDLGIGSHTRF